MSVKRIYGPLSFFARIMLLLKADKIDCYRERGMLCYSYMRIEGVALDAEQFADIKAGERHLLALISYEKLSVK